LNTRLSAAQTIAQINIPKEVNLNSKSEHVISARLDGMSREDLERLAAVARMEQEGTIILGDGDFKRVDGPVCEAGSQD